MQGKRTLLLLENRHVRSGGQSRKKGRPLVRLRGSRDGYSGMSVTEQVLKFCFFAKRLIWMAGHHASSYHKSSLFSRHALRCSDRFTSI
jgi:hypothetical protein